MGRIKLRLNLEGRRIGPESLKAEHRVRSGMPRLVNTQPPKRNPLSHT
jgi:hypothetical protein